MRHLRLELWLVDVRQEFTEPISSEIDEIHSDSTGGNRFQGLPSKKDLGGRYEERDL